MGGLTEEDLFDIGNELRQSINLYDQVINDETSSASDKIEARLGKGDAYIALAKAKNRFGLIPEIYEEDLLNAFNEFGIVETQDLNSDQKSRSLVGQARVNLDRLSVSGTSAYYQQLYNQALLRLERALEEYPTNLEARDLLSATRIGTLGAIYSRLEDNKNEVVEFSLIDIPDPSESMAWFQIKNGFGDTLDVYRTLYEEYVHLGELSLSDEKARVARNLIQKQAGINLLINFERAGGDLNRFYLLYDDEQEQLSYLKSVFTKHSSVRDSEYNEGIVQMHYNMNRALMNKDVNLLARNGRAVSGTGNNLVDEFGLPTTQSFIFLTPKAYYGDSRFALKWYDHVTDGVNAVSVGLTVAVGMPCARLAGQSVAQIVSARYLTAVPGYSQLGTIGTFGVGIIGTEAAISVGVPPIFAEPVGELAVPGKQITRKLFKEGLRNLKWEIERTLIGKEVPLDVTESVSRKVERGLATKNAQQVLADIRSEVSSFSAREFDEVLDRTYKSSRPVASAGRAEIISCSSSYCDYGFIPRFGVHGIGAAKHVNPPGGAFVLNRQIPVNLKSEFANAPTATTIQEINQRVAQGKNHIKVGSMKKAHEFIDNKLREINIDVAKEFQEITYGRRMFDEVARRRGDGQDIRRIIDSDRYFKDTSDTIIENGLENEIYEISYEVRTTSQGTQTQKAKARYDIYDGLGLNPDELQHINFDYFEVDGTSRRIHLIIDRLG